MGSTGYAKQITARDEKLMMQLAKTGLASTEQAEKYCDVKEKRLKRLQRSKYIKMTTITQQGKEVTLIQLDTKGKALVRNKEMNDTPLAKAQIDHAEHDLKLTERYYQYTPEQQKTFRSEQQLVKEIYKERPYLINKLETCIDATVEIDGQTIGIEVIGKTYTEKTIELKKDIAKTYLNIEKIEWIGAGK